MLFESTGEQLVGIARLASNSPLLEAKSCVDYFELPARSILNRCTSHRVPFAWTINPYRGCEFGCKYCYARYTHEFMELRDARDFESKIFAKRFVAQELRTELARVGRDEAIAIGTATDPYQPAERRFRITREILKVFAEERNRRISITTKSDLVTRDLSLLRQIARANILHVNFTITTLSTKLARLLEPGAPRPDLRLQAMRKLAGAELIVGVFTNPIMPLLTDSEESLDAVASAAAQSGASYFGGAILFLKPCSKQVFFPFLEEKFPHLVRRYRECFERSAFLRGAYPAMIKERLKRIRERHGLASAPTDYRPELWQDEPQRELFSSFVSKST
jgi:DNA repair photolyase